MNRRHFINNTGKAVLAGVVAGFPLSVFATDAPEKRMRKLTILHTNDVHSRLEAFPMDGSKTQGLGGVAKRSSLIQKIRQEEDNVLLLDSGDMFQGTPYFNYYKGELEFKAMSAMQYDASTLGNHDFDGSVETLAEKFDAFAQFSLINSNYSFENTPMNKKVLPYKIFEKDDIRIGVTGVGIELYGLVPQKLYGDTVYNDPIAAANKQAEILKHDEKCDYVICLSHLGYKFDSQKVSDIQLAQQSKNIDLILGGHTHTFMDKPDIQKNLDGQEVLIHQVGWAGIVLGRLDVYFEKKSRCITCGNQTVK